VSVAEETRVQEESKESVHTSLYTYLTEYEEVRSLLEEEARSPL
jgi:hypothetical protein